MEKCLAVIPARGGSKGIPRKNLQELQGIPLIAHTIQAAKKSKLISRVIVSTDDEEIADVSRLYGAEVPFIRPEELGSDTASSVDVVVHALSECESDGDNYSMLVLLQPTCPFRTADDIDSVIEMLLEDLEAQSAITVKPVPNECNPHYIYKLEDKSWSPLVYSEKIQRRQDLPQYFVRTGDVYAVRTDYLKENNKVIGEHNLVYVMSEEVSVNIDTPLDLLVARTIVENGLRSKR